MWTYSFVLKKTTICLFFLFLFHLSAAMNKSRLAFTRSHYEQFFRKADKDQDGYLSIKELREYFRDNGYNGTESDIRVSGFGFVFFLFFYIKKKIS